MISKKTRCEKTAKPNRFFASSCLGRVRPAIAPAAGGGALVGLTTEIIERCLSTQLVCRCWRQEWPIRTLVDNGTKGTKRGLMTMRSSVGQRKKRNNLTWMEYCFRWVWKAALASLVLIHSYPRPHVLVASIQGDIGVCRGPQTL